ncbi:unnamed protein product [Symbiodinium necroappetens]|uniref:Uncharacterized protein n=1 Tax=Symbiodinium necroappetens TaxID=1628268 RepID=A0A812ZE91_9DINO|nr:unnamed protein product [Symbiodinium necroappetens]
MPTWRQSSGCDRSYQTSPYEVGSWMRGEPIGRSKSRYRRPIGSGMWSFVMVGYSFGLASAVYNYNGRSAAITDILRRVFTVANFYDDGYGFEPSGTAEGAFALVEQVHWWLGSRFDQQKLQLCSELFDDISLILERDEPRGLLGGVRGLALKEAKSSMLAVQLSQWPIPSLSVRLDCSCLITPRSRSNTL